MPGKGAERDEWPAQGAEGFDALLRGRLGDGGPGDRGSLGSLTIQRQQLVVRNFLNGSPYRGLLVFHGLGSGKTCAAIAAVEALSAQQGMRDVVVMLPASLRGNFEKEIGRCGGEGMRSASIRYVSTNGVSPAAIDAKTASIAGRSLHGCVIVVDEVHNLATQAANGGARGTALYHAICNARGAKVIMLSGSAVVNSPFELALLLNMIAGPRRTLVLYRPRLPSDDLEALMRAELRVLSHERTGTSVRVVPAPEGYRRRDAHSSMLVKMEKAAAAAVRTARAGDKALGTDLAEAVDATHWITETRTAFPDDEEQFRKMFVDGDRIHNRAAFEKGALGMVSYFAITAAQALAYGIPDVVSDTVVQLDMSGIQFLSYSRERTIEIEKERLSRWHSRQGDDDAVGTFKTISRIVCNFAFEREADRPFPSSRSGAHSQTDSEAGEEVVQRALALLQADDMAELRGARLAAHSPKMAAIMHHIRTGPAPSLIYSHFRKLEGIRIMSMVLEAAGFSRLVVRGGEVAPETDPKKRVFYVFESEGDTVAALDVFNGNVPAWNRLRKKGAPPVDVILITAAGAEGIDLHGLRQVHIMEPHWNETRMQQVIGRAVRMRSHLHLPAEERHVDVFRYVMRLAEGKQRAVQSIKSADGNLTSDQLVLESARRKQALLQSFLEALQTVAVDCGLYPRDPGGSGPKCHGEPRPDSASRGSHVLVRKNGVLYIRDTDSGTLYSYEEYARSKRLLAVREAPGRIVS